MTMPTTPGALFEDTDPDALLRDFAYVAERMRRDVSTGRRSVADATYTLSAAWELLTRLLLTVPLPRSPGIPSPPLRRTMRRPRLSC